MTPLTVSLSHYPSTLCQRYGFAGHHGLDRSRGLGYMHITLKSSPRGIVTLSSWLPTTFSSVPLSPKMVPTRCATADLASTRNPRHWASMSSLPCGGDAAHPAAAAGARGVVHRVRAARAAGAP